PSKHVLLYVKCFGYAFQESRLRRSKRLNEPQFFHFSSCSKKNSSGVENTVYPTKTIKILKEKDVYTKICFAICSQFSGEHSNFLENIILIQNTSYQGMNFVLI